MINLENSQLKNLYLRVNNRDKNIKFYETNFGFKTYHEENAIVEMGGHDVHCTRLILEESPSYRYREVNGLKKLEKLIIKADVKEIGQLIARGACYDKIYQGIKGYGFESISPEGDKILIHGEDKISDLKPISTPYQLPSVNPEFTGLTDFQISNIVFNVPNFEKSISFYQFLFNKLPNEVEFLEVENDKVTPDLTVENDQTWDLEILEFSVPEITDLAKVKEKLEVAGYPVFLANHDRLLVTQDSSKIEIWLSK